MGLPNTEKMDHDKTDSFGVAILTGSVWPIYILGKMGARLTWKQIAKVKAKALEAAKIEEEEQLALAAYEKEQEVV